MSWRSLPEVSDPQGTTADCTGWWPRDDTKTRDSVLNVGDDSGRYLWRWWTPKMTWGSELFQHHIRTTTVYAVRGLAGLARQGGSHATSLRLPSRTCFGSHGVVRRSKCRIWRCRSGGQTANPRACSHSAVRPKRSLLPHLFLSYCDHAKARSQIAGLGRNDALIAQRLCQEVRRLCWSLSNAGWG